MRYLMSFFIMLCTLRSIDASAQIEFYQGTWEEAKVAAARQGKLIFVDCYASWCGPCRWMDENVFSDYEVGYVFNSRYISLKINMEGYRRADFIQQYQRYVKAYPTFLFLDASGKVRFHFSGATDVQAFVDTGRKVWSWFAP